MLIGEEVSIFNIIFERVYDNHIRVNIQTISTETLEFVFSLYRIKTRERFPLKFSFKGKQLDPKLSLVDAGLSDNSIIITDIFHLPIIDLKPWTILFYRQGLSLSIPIEASPNMLVKELISLFMLKSGETSKFKFIFNYKELIPELKIVQSGLTNGSKITVINTQSIVGAGYPRWYYKLINIKFIKISKSIDTNTTFFNSELTSLLKLCLLKEISSKFNFLYLDNKCRELKKNIPDLIYYILNIISNGFVISEDIKKTITEVIEKEGGENIINFSKFVDKVVDQYQISQIKKLLNPDDFKEIQNIEFLLSKYNEHIVLFDKDFERAKKESIFEFSIISMVIIERQDYEKFEEERKKCPNRVDKILFHGTSVEPISCILKDLFKKSVDRCYQHGKGVYFTDFLDYCWFYGGNVSNRANENIIPKVDDNFTLIACSTYFDKKRFRKVNDYKYTPKKNEINFAYAGPRFETVFNPDFTKFVGTEYVIWDLDQICPFISAKLKRNEYCVIWRDNNFSSKPVYNNRFDAIFKKFLEERKKYINQEGRFNIYTCETSEEALKLVERKKYNKIILISNIGTDLGGKKFITEARKILGNDVIALFLAYNIKHLEWVKDFNNSLFSNEPKFYEKYLNCFCDTVSVSIDDNIKLLINEMEIFYKIKFKFDNNYLNFPLFKESGEYSDLTFNN